MKYNVRISKGKPTKVAIMKPVTLVRSSKKNGTKINAVRTIIEAIIRLSCKGKISVKLLSEEAVKVLSSLYLTLLNMVSNFGVTKIDTRKTRILSVISISTIFEQIVTKNIIFQKLSLFSLALIQFIQLITYNSYRSIVSSINKKLKLNRIPLVIITAALFTNVTYAGELESLIAQAEKTHSIPKDLLLSIALVESRINPNVLNVEGKAVISKSLSEVKGKLKQYLKSGYTSIDIGVMQVNYRWHREQFVSLDEMLDPKTNIDYAARFLKQLYKTHGSWIKAVRHYHSANPEHHKKYSRKIIVTWLNP